MRDALRALELRDDYESPALEAALLEGVRGPHRPYGKSTLHYRPPGSPFHNSRLGGQV